MYTLGLDSGSTYFQALEVQELTDSGHFKQSNPAIFGASPMFDAHPSLLLRSSTVSDLRPSDVPARPRPLAAQGYLDDENLEQLRGDSENHRLTCRFLVFTNINHIDSPFSHWLVDEKRGV